MSGAADTDPTTVATLVVVGAAAGYGLAWLTLLSIPAVAVVQVLATRVGTLTGRNLQSAVRDGYGRLAGSLLLVSVLTVNTVTVGADLAAGAAAIGLLVGLESRWLVPVFAAAVLALLFVGRYDEVERVLKWAMVGLLAYGAAVVLARPDWAAVARGSLLPPLSITSTHLAGAVAILGTLLTTYMYLWQTVEQVEERAARTSLRVREFDAVTGATLACLIAWCILVASGATLGTHHESVDTAQQAAQVLRPLAGPLASELFAVGLLAAAVVAAPVIMAAGGYAAASAFGWERGLTRSPRQAPGFYTLIALQAVVGAVLAMGTVSPIRLLFVASLVAGVATPFGLVMLVLCAGNAKLVGGRPIARGLRVAGWLVAAGTAALSLVFLLQQLHVLRR
ncbi:Nramp family divalent metal transporter [Polymorphospora rubra]|uniref:Nramp family divalent metal transporter n=1 Tax=Polymorphospora rubra TaxID=338584 RepID=UPI001BB39913|nr:Nramp family divalent metal transporter [Polymorphospora rubra]